MTDTIPHGQPPGFKSPSGYINHGCRCDECKDAASAYFTDWHRRNPDAKRRYCETPGRKRYLKRRRMVGVKCISCGWRGRRDAADDPERVIGAPCPHCGGGVV